VPTLPFVCPIQTLKEGASKADCEEAKKSLEEAGAVVAMK